MLIKSFVGIAFYGNKTSSVSYGVRMFTAARRVQHSKLRAVLARRHRETRCLTFDCTNTLSEHSDGGVTGGKIFNRWIGKAANVFSTPKPIMKTIQRQKCPMTALKLYCAKFAQVENLQPTFDVLNAYFHKNTDQTLIRFYRHT